MDYNQFVNISKITVLLLGLALVASLSAFSLPADASQPTGYDLAAVVNAYRVANGYYQLDPHAQVMAAAQAHADWIVETGQGGHIGAGGSDETTRVSWTGYGDGATILCDENWAGGSSIDDVMAGAWSDWTHQEVMLNTWRNHDQHFRMLLAERRGALRAQYRGELSGLVSEAIGVMRDAIWKGDLLTRLWAAHAVLRMLGLQAAVPAQKQPSGEEIINEFLSDIIRKVAQE